MIRRNNRFNNKGPGMTPAPPSNQESKGNVMSNATDSMNQDIHYIPLNKLELSPLNVRKTKTGADDLIASIKANGMMQNLSVYPGKKGRHLVFSGGRRLAALKALQAEGHFTEDYAVPCHVYSQEQAQELSLAENTIRLAMHPADQFEAFAALAEKGQTAEQIATRFGCTVKLVEQRMKLARVAPKIIKDYRAEKITLETLIAFAVTDDQARQLAVYKSSVGRTYPQVVRNSLTEGKIRATDRRVKFVTLETYEKAGGTVTTDLFAEEDTIFLDNPELLQALTDEKLKLTEAEFLAEGWGWAKVDESRDWNATAGSGRLIPDIDAPQELLDAKAQAEAEVDAIDKEWQEADEDDEALLDAIQQRHETAQDRLQDIHRQIRACAAYDPEEMKEAGCYAYLNHDGTLQVERGIVRRGEAEPEAEPEETPAKAEPKPKGMPESLKRDLAAYRLGAAQVEIAKHPAIAFDLLVFKMAKGVCSHGHAYDGPQVAFQRNYGGHAGREARDFVDSHMEAVKAELPLDWLELDTEAAQFAAFQLLPDADKHRILAFCVASTLQPKLHEGKAASAYDMALAQTGANVADYWRPTRENYLSRVSRMELLGIGRQLFSDQWANARFKEKKSNLVDALHTAFASDDATDKTRNWLPEGMAFTQSEPAEGKEAA